MDDTGSHTVLQVLEGIDNADVHIIDNFYNSFPGTCTLNFHSSVMTSITG